MGYSKDIPVRKRQQTPYRLPVSHVQITRRMINHKTHANCAAFRNIKSTQQAMRASAPKPTNENQNREFRVTHDSKTPTLRINDVYTIEVEICLKRHSAARMRVNWVEVEARLPRRVAQEFEVQARRSELGRGSDGSTPVGNPVSEKKKC